MTAHAQPLHLADLLADPLAQFRAWFAAAGEGGVRTPEAMALATATPWGVPSARMVLLKGTDERGFSFFSNHLSRKGGELDENPRAALLFHWDALGQQIRIEGSVERLPAAESDAYFRTRAPGSRIGAIASPQSRPIVSREWLESRVAEVTAEVGEGEPERPEHWGGYVLRPAAYQFWQHRSDRLHDCFRYLPVDASGGWSIERLGP